MSIQQSLEGLLLRGEIERRGYAEFEHGIPADIIENLVGTYADFTLAHPNPDPSTMDAMLEATPDNLEDFKLDDLDRSKDTQSEWHKYRTNIPGIGKPDGYTSRSFQADAIMRARGVDIGEDPKEFYHYTPVHYAAMSRLHEELDWGAIPPEVGALNQAFNVIHIRAGELTVKICSIIEETHPEIRKLITPQSIHTSPVRLLFYHPSDTMQLGAAHYDKSITTLQLAESHEGLRLAATPQAELTPVVRNADKAVFFPSRMLRDTIDKFTPYQPGWHDIVKVNRLNEGRNVPAKAIEVCARWALIFFANAEGYIDPGKAATHHR